MIGLALCAEGRNIDISAVDRPAAEVFRMIVEQTDYNFVYSSELLKNLRLTVDAKDKPLKKVLSDIFHDTDIAYKIKGKNIILSRKKAQKKLSRPKKESRPAIIRTDTTTVLPELEVVSRTEAPPVETVEIGARKISGAEIKNIPSLFGENDVIKALQMQPGIAAGTEGFAGMNVHGGEHDENLYMLDNVPIYQVNHFAGLFSAFNTDIINYIDFYKTSMPAKYDGRLSSFMDVRLRNGLYEHHGGSARLGLTSGAFNIAGPIGSRTSYLIGLRRSWYDILTIPILAIVNSKKDEKIRAGYAFGDFNAKIYHSFSPDVNGFVSAYYGNDYLRSGSEEKFTANDYGWFESDKYNLDWGNIVVQAGLDWRINEDITSEFTAAYTRYFSTMKHDDVTHDISTESVDVSQSLIKTDNNISDLIFRGDFIWRPDDMSRIKFGAGYTRHSFLPERTSRSQIFNDTDIYRWDSTYTYGANELNAYIEYGRDISDKLQADMGLHASLFDIDGDTRHGISPRVSLSYRPVGNVAVKAAYSHTVQYVHQLAQTYLSLPTDQWIPVCGRFKPQSADKVAIGAYWGTDGGNYTVSAEAYLKSMHNLLDYRDEYYLRPPLDIWNDRLTSGKGSAKGIDFKIEKVYGKITGHIAYSLAWADRTFKEKNGGRTYPARFDNRHTVNIAISWKASDKVQLNAAWTGHSGNRFTLLSQVWEGPDFDGYTDNVPLRADINNYRLPFYHRLDLSCNVRNRHGYWSFGLYNAYCHMNTVGIRLGHKKVYKETSTGVSTKSIPVFQKIKLLPIIPSISYTWEF